MFEGQEIGALGLEEACRALERPVEATKRGFGDGVIDRVVERTGQYPYFIQHYGRELWDATEDAVVDLQTFSDNEDSIRGKLDDYFFRSRFVRATQAERGVMGHIASFGERATIQELLEQTQRRNNSLQMVVRGLVNKGLVYRPTRGKLRSPLRCSATTSAARLNEA
jgi:hypothetical protein